MALWTLGLLCSGVALVAFTHLLERQGMIETSLLTWLTNGEQWSDAVFPVFVGNETFIIDGRQLRRIERSETGVVERIELALPIDGTGIGLLSDVVFEPAEARISDSVFVSIQHRSTITDAAQRLERIYPYYIESEPRGTAYELTQHRFADDTAYANQELFQGTLSDGAAFAMRCDVPRDDGLPSMCRRQIVGEGNLAIIYRYHRDHLSQWRTIETMVAALIGELWQPESGS
jgi:hypothetical protein